MKDQASKRYCPICKKIVFFFGKVEGETLTSCGHTWSFNKSRSQKDFDRKYIKTEWGFELRSPEK